MFLPLRPGRFLTQASSRLSHQAVCKLHSINQPLKTRTYTLWINIWKAVHWNAGLFSCTILCMTLVCTLLIPINPSVSYQHQQDYQQRPSEEVTEDNRETLQITFVSVQKFECFYARCWMCTQYQCKHFFFFLNAFDGVCWSESRLNGLADYQCLCICSLSVYSDLFEGRIWKRHPAIDQTSQGEQWTEPCLFTLYWLQFISVCACEYGCERVC